MTEAERQHNQLEDQFDRKVSEMNQKIKRQKMMMRISSRMGSRTGGRKGNRMTLGWAVEQAGRIVE